MYDSRIHHRRSIRLRGYDYSSPGRYFVTICANDHLHLFGKLLEGAMHLNDVGQMVRSVWTEMPNRYSNCQADAFVIMPNHVHGVIVIDRSADRGPAREPAQARGQARGPAPTTLSLGDLVHRFKSLTTARYRQGTRTQGWPPLNGRLSVIVFRSTTGQARGPAPTTTQT